jgi:hypothetical protein
MTDSYEHKSYAIIDNLQVYITYIGMFTWSQSHIFKCKLSLQWVDGML